MIINSSRVLPLSSSMRFFGNLPLGGGGGSSSSALHMACSNPSALQSVAIPAARTVMLLAIRGGGGIMTRHLRQAVPDETFSMATAATTAAVGTAATSTAAGGAAAAAAHSLLDIGRVKMRLEGLQAYATLCALLANACLRLYSTVKTPKPAEEEKATWWNKLAMDIFLLSVVVSVLSGSYVTIVFSLLALFSKTALGRGYDEPFLQFFAATADLRESGFESFLYCLVSFEVAFILSLFLKYKGNRRALLLCVAVGISAYSVSHWASIMKLAAIHLFPLRAEVEY